MVNWLATIVLVRPRVSLFTPSPLDPTMIELALIVLLAPRTSVPVTPLWLDVTPSESVLRLAVNDASPPKSTLPLAGPTPAALVPMMTLAVLVPGVPMSTVPPVAPKIMPVLTPPPPPAVALADGESAEIRVERRARGVDPGGVGLVGIGDRVGQREADAARGRADRERRARRVRRVESL